MAKYIYYSEEEQIYRDKYKGHFNKKLADWAISNMEREDASGALVRVQRKGYDEYDKFAATNSLNIPDESYYDGYYLWHMAYADYPKALPEDKSRADFIKETILDPDCEPTAVLACFVAKMELCGTPIFWERFF